MSTAPHTIDVTISNFETEVVNYSMDCPVLLDFWAAWCGPCKTLTPVLEKVVADMGGAVRLAKVDTDANPELAQAFRIQGIPAVFLVDQGRPVDGFQGVRSEAEVKSFLEGHVTPGTSDDVQAALDLAAAGKVDEAIEALRALLREDGTSVNARIELARLLAESDRVPEAKKVFDKLTPEEQEGDDARAVAAMLEFGEHKADLDALRAKVEAAPKDLAQRLALGRALIAARNYEEGLEELLEVAMRDLAFDEGAARKAMIEAFELLGDDEPLVREFRQRLSILLCS